MPGKQWEKSSLCSRNGDRTADVLDIVDKGERDSMHFELTAEQLDLQARARRFMDDEVLPNYQSWPLREEDYGAELITWLNATQEKYGINKINVPKEYGGRGLGAIEDVIVLTEIARCPRHIPGNAYSPWPAMYESSEAIKQKYLYPVLDGKTGWSLCFTEPGAGSDLSAMTTSAVRKGSNWVLNGRKLWHTEHALASYTAVAAVTDPSKGTRGISIFLVDHGTPGFRPVRQIPVLSRSWGVEEELELDNVVVPHENLLGEEGAGFAIAQHQFNRFRLRLGGSALGISERSQELAVAYAKEREVFGGKLGENQAIQWMLTDNFYDIESIRWNTLHTAWLVDKLGYPAARLHVAAVKAYCIDAGLRVVDRSMQVLGGRGLAVDDYPFGDFYGFLRMCKQMEGSTEIMKIVMAREILGQRM